jgi:hypothetical protein
MPFGLHPIGRLDGTPYFADQERYPIAVGYTTAIFHRDPVKLSSGTIIRGTAAQSIFGVLIGCEYTTAAGQKVFDDWWPGLTGCTNIRATIVSSPDVVFEAETTAGAGNITQAYVGALVDFALGTGNTFTGLSGAGVGASGGAGLKVLRVPDSPGNELGTTLRRVHVVPILHELRP